MFALAVLRAKEGVAEDVMATVGRPITDPILQMVDGSDYRKVDD